MSEVLNTRTGNNMQQESAEFGGLSPDWVMAAILAVGESLWRAIAPRDLADVPLYIIRQSMIADEFGSADGCDAFTSPALDLYLKDHIGNRWEGRGPCMVINDTILLAETHADDLEHVTLGIVLHELAHILDRESLYADRRDTEPMRLKFESLIVAEAISRPNPTVDVPAYFGHGLSFIRIALHLRHRSMQHHALVSPSSLCAGRLYGLSHALRYRESLGDEPDRLADRSFQDIRSIEPPPAFRQLWTDDVRDYRKRFPKSVNGVPT